LAGPNIEQKGFPPPSRAGPGTISEMGGRKRSSGSVGEPAAGRFRSSPIQSKSQTRRRIVARLSGRRTGGTGRVDRTQREQGFPRDKRALERIWARRGVKGAAREQQAASSERRAEPTAAVKGRPWAELGLGVDARADRPAVRRAGGVKDPQGNILS